MKPKKSNEKSNKKTNEKSNKKATKRCCLCGGEFEGHGNNPAPLKEGGVCCDKCNIEKVLPARAKLANAEIAKKTARNEYAREYYKKNAEKIRESSRKSHAKHATLVKELMNETCDLLLGIASENGQDWFSRFGDPSVVARLAAFLGKAMN